MPIPPLTSAAPLPSPGIARRLATRWALLAFGLYHVPLFLNAYPSFGGGGFQSDGLAQAWGRVFTPVGIWVARHVFGMTGPMPYASAGDNGDVAEEFGRLLAGVVLAIIAAGIWTLADRRRPRARWAGDALRVLLRYSIALGLASYGMAKIYPVQFGELSPVSLEARVGELSPMGLLWRFMEYSSAYSTFSGVLEMLVVVLLCFRRTATLGALLSLPVMANVALLNVCYGVPVKLFSIITFLSAIVIVLPDARRLIDVLILHRAAPPAPLAPPFRSPRLNQARWVVKLIAVGGVIASSAYEMHSFVHTRNADTADPVYGIWDVESFAIAGREADAADPARWRRLAVGSRSAGIRLVSDEYLRCQLNRDVAATLALSCRGDRKAELRWTRDGDLLRLEGTYDSAQVAVVLKRRDESQIPLLRARFYWTMD